MKVREGCYRIVFIFNKIVIKIPNFKYQHNHFLYGLYNNWEERRLYKMWKKNNHENVNLICPSLFCSWFGLIQIMEKADEYIYKIEDEDLFEKLKTISHDVKDNNLGVLNGNIVLVDYA